MSINDIKYRVGFSLVSGIGRVKSGVLESYFNNLGDAWLAGPSELKQAGLDSASIRSLISSRGDISLDDEMAKLERAGVKVYSFRDEGYPARLKEIYDYPPVIYVKGEIQSEDTWCLSVVGTRKATAYGKQVTEELVTDLSRNGITIVSGLARGIDTVAHKAALAAGGRTIAIFACGLDTIYPPENADLAKRIVQNGAIISEYPLGVRPRPDYFPRRNRIMSGISLGVLVIEAGQSSGAIITANMALEQNREVFAVPGSILSPVSKGTNQLLQEGAKLVTEYTDIIEEFNLTAVARQMEIRDLIPETDTEAGLMKLLGAEPVHIDEVCRSSGLPVSVVSSTLAMMELKGLVKQVGAMNYSLAREAREDYRMKIN